MKTILLLMTAILVLSCHKELYNDSNLERMNKNLDPFIDYEVPVKSGCTTYVLYGEDTLAVCNEPRIIKIPREAMTLTKAAENPGIKIDYGILKDIDTYSHYWQAVMFEDSEVGDYDYNDLIIHVRNEVKSPWGKDYDLLQIDIQPIALGGMKEISLGCILSDKTEHIVSMNVREDLFLGKSGFINTMSKFDPIRYKLEPWITEYKLPRNSLSSIAWFIEVSGRRYYAISAELDYKNYNMFDSRKMPYGLVVYSHFSYAEEMKSISEVYPDFNGWISGDKGNIGKSVQKDCYLYSYGNIYLPDGSQKKIWDYKDLE